MSDVAIRVEGLGKRYRIGQRERYRTLRDTVTDAIRAPARLLPSLRHHRDGVSASRSDAHVWALKDVSFEVKRGEVVGIIGRNGAGKSTLLKILSRITEPTEGEVEVRGRVGSLLEVGTGFHPELTGRENVYLNGAIMGMKRAEIERQFDEIVAFAEIEQFLDTPVKHYSSGMYMRLAFAVAAHLDPEIMIVDEVLAVGDASFQKKCLGKMGDVAREGRTVVFVSHNMAAVASLCSEAYLLESGHLTYTGETNHVIDKYMRSITSLAAVPLHARTDRNGNGQARVTLLSIDSGSEGAPVRCGDPLRVRIFYTATNPLSRAQFLVGIYDHLNRPIFFLDSRTAGDLPAVIPASGCVTCTTGSINLTPGPCIVNVALLVGNTMADHVTHVCTLEIEADDFYGTGNLTSRETALCLLSQKWEVG